MLPLPCALTSNCIMHDSGASTSVVLGTVLSLAMVYMVLEFVPMVLDDFEWATKGDTCMAFFCLNPRMFQECFRNVSGIFQECFRMHMTMFGVCGKVLACAKKVSEWTRFVNNNKYLEWSDTCT